MERYVKKRGKKSTAKQSKTIQLPIAYHQIIHQLKMERRHGSHHNTGHEAQRRAVYAGETLDALGRELFNPSLVGGANFRSKVLNPELQRQMHGVPSHYTPVVRRAVANGDREVTIRDATEFYLKHDPVDPRMIPVFRRNLIYIPEARWHLGIVMGVTKPDSVPSFNRIHKNQDRIMEALQKGPNPSDDTGVPLLNATELEVLYEEKIHQFFDAEIKRVVGYFLNCYLRPLSVCSNSLTSSKKSASCTRPWSHPRVRSQVVVRPSPLSPVYRRQSVPTIRMVPPRRSHGPRWEFDDELR